MDARTPSRNSAEYGRDQPSSRPTSQHAGASMNTRLGAAFAATSPTTSSLSTSQASGSLSHPYGAARTPLLSARHGYTPHTGAASPYPAQGDYFSQTSMTSGPQATSPTASRRQAPRTPSASTPLWSGGHSRHGSHELPVRDHGRGQGRPTSSRQIQSRQQRPEALPSYPNTSAVAFGYQKYPTWYPAPFDARGSETQDRAIAFQSAQEREFFSRGNDAVEERLRTVANTPVTTPGLYSSEKPLLSIGSAIEEDNSYRSPYLHPSQRQPPKTTTNAVKDIDSMSGRKMVNNYEILDELGRGVHGKVKLARNLENGVFVAIKVVQRYSKKKRLGKPSSPEDKVKKEVAILKKAQHPNVVSMLEVIDDPDMTKVYIVLEFCELKEISWRVLGVPEIVILENRRLESERHGAPDLNDAARNEPIVKKATMRLEAQQQRSRPQRKRTKSEFTWSLEYGGDSEEEDGNKTEGEHDETSAQHDITPTASMVQHDTQREYVREEQQYATSGEVSPAGTKSPQSRAMVEEENEFGQFRDIEYGSQWNPRDPHNVAGSSLGFPVLEEIRSKRRASKAESIASQMTEAMEIEVQDEELRYVPTMTLSECRSAFRDAVVGVDYLHHQGIVHRDIKPANLLRTIDHTVKISDFGVSYLGKPIRDGEESADTSESEAGTTYDDEVDEAKELAKTVGTPAFFAPELCMTENLADELPQVTGQIDVWALGVTLYCMLFARTPFLAESEWALMSKINTEDVVIPKKRLKSVDPKGLPSSPSFGPYFPPDRRRPDEWVHESIDDELRDLLRRLFIKDSTKRITIKEIKHHPWVLRDIANPASWIEETDPARKEHGKKIEISEEDFDKAVKPLEPGSGIIDKLKAAKNKFVRGAGFGFSRKRDNDTTAASEANSIMSLHPATDREPRRQSLMSAGEHLSGVLRAAQQSFNIPRSATASPDPESRHGSSTASSRHSSLTSAPIEPIAAPRPSMPDRNESDLSTAASIRTLRPSDFERSLTSTRIDEDVEQEEQQELEDEMAGTEHTLVGQQTGPSLRTVFGGAGTGANFRRPISRQPSSYPTGGSSLNSPDQTTSPDTPFGEASVALAHTTATGQAYHGSSASSSRKSSLVESLSRKSSTASRKASVTPAITSTVTTPSAYLSPIGWHGGTPVMLGGGASSFAQQHDQDTTPEEHDAAMQRLYRRQEIQLAQDRERANRSRNQMRLSGVDSSCPPSPDDETDTATSRPATASGQRPPSRDFFSEGYSVAAMSTTPMHQISSTSSSDQFNLSQSTSYPSINSSSSYQPDISSPAFVPPKLSSDESSTGTHSSGETAVQEPIRSSSPMWTPAPARPSRPIPVQTQSYGSFASSEAITDEDDSSEEDGLMMGGKKNRSSSISNAQLQRKDVKAASKRMKKTTRSGSTGSSNTMKKIRSHSMGDDDAEGGVGTL